MRNVQTTTILLSASLEASTPFEPDMSEGILNKPPWRSRSRSAGHGLRNSTTGRMMRKMFGRIAGEAAE